MPVHTSHFGLSADAALVTGKDAVTISSTIAVHMTDGARFDIFDILPHKLHNRDSGDNTHKFFSDSIFRRMYESVHKYKMMSDMVYVLCK